MPDPAPAPSPASSNAPADTSNNAALGATLYPNGADNEKGGGTGQATSAQPPSAPAEPSAATTGEPKADAAAPPVKPAQPSGEGEPAKPDDNAAPPLTVESYAKLTLPEDFAVHDDLMGAFKTLGVETSTPPEVAQKYLNLYVDAVKAYNTQLAEAWTSTQKAWTDATSAMPEFQGERKAQSEQIIGAVLDEFIGAPTTKERQEFNQAMNATGMGNHPYLSKLILELASALVEDEPPPVGQPAAENRRGRSLGQILYPSTPTN